MKDKSLDPMVSGSEGFHCIAISIMYLTVMNMHVCEVYMYMYMYTHNVYVNFKLINP